MKKWMILSMVFAALPAAMMAQDDDMYFASSKQKNQQQSASHRTQSVNVSRGGGDVYYSGSKRSVDDYNRRLQSSYEVLPADTGDIISFAPVEGVYPDSVGDFQLTQQMQRWDDYVPTTAYWEGYAQGQRDSYGWHSPWYYSSYYPWYDSWYYDRWYYDPWYYSSWHYGWYCDPWYYGYGWYGYHHPHYYYGGGHGYARQNGTIDRYGRTSGGSFSGNRSGGINSRGASVRSDVGRNLGSHSNGRNTVRSTNSGSGSFTGSRSSSYGGSSSGSGSFSGSRSTSSGSSSGGGFSGSSSRGGGGGSMSSGGGRSGGSRR